jgi:hypothetical protein
MAISLYDASVSSYLQTLAAVSGFLDRGLAHCQESDVNPEEIVNTSIFPDMLPFRFQVQSVVHQSAGALEGMKSGVFRPPGNLPQHDYAGLQALIAETREAMGKLTPEEINGLEDNDVIFEVRDMKRRYTAEGFLLSFSLPNFYFHATTAYDILRSKGVPLGKRDFMGPPRLKA